MPARCLIAAAAALLLAGAAPAQDSAQYAAERMRAMPQDRAVEAVEAYAPAEVVGGRDRALPQGRPAGDLAQGIMRGQAYLETQQSFAYLVLHRGRLVHEWYAPGFGAKSRFSTASMHKTVIALAVGAAVDSGRMRLDDPMERYLTEWRGDPRGAITLRQVLQMASGLDTAPFSPDPASLPAQLMFGPDIAATALAWPRAVEPGTFAYGNVNSQVAMLALSRAVGVRYSQWLSRRLWKPIGAGDAALWLDRPDGTPHAFCCLQATARDWARVGQLIADRGRVGGTQVISGQWIDEMVRPSPANPIYGLQLWRGTPHVPLRSYSANSPFKAATKEPFARDDVVYLDGFGGQRVYVVPSERLVIVRIGRVSTTWDDSVLPNLLLEGA